MSAEQDMPASGPWRAQLYGGPYDGHKVTVHRCVHGDWSALGIPSTEPEQVEVYAFCAVHERYEHEGRERLDEWQAKDGQDMSPDYEPGDRA